ncbi:MAG: heavy metal-binding domain-containing protein [Bacteroidetes bacterium]|nr:heavy metal-binding domain-containing protein [Bacteroidota bacterium]MDA1119883.1 heavy metal-binding domain-containing protein [Bacteroidota bacterium]
MKKTLITMAVSTFILCTGSMYLTSCGGDQNKEATHQHTDGEAQGEMIEGSSEATVYACSMHPEVTGIKGDKCSKCGMDLELLTADESEHADHEH